MLAAVERRMSNAEIAAGLHISVRTVESHIAALRRKLDADSRGKLIAAAQSRRGAAVQVPRNSFVGREPDLAAVRALLERDRWVTVVGPPGCGKTRLALELASADPQVPVVVELEHATADGVPAAVAGAIGMHAERGPSLVAACGVALRGRRHLLVLDNCDRVTTAVGALVAELLAAAGALTVLATARGPLGGSDETVYPLAPLPVGPATAELFADRARSAAPGVRLTAADADLVTRICARLDGLPLAIELAAARVRHLPLPELAARLEEGFGPLDRVGPAGRHRTLEAAFGWTWDLLDDEERGTLSRLAALPDTFDLELAEAVTAPGAGRVVLRLLDRSLVAQTATVSHPRRFRLLDSLRAFVLDRTGPDTVRAVRLAHAAHQTRLAAAVAATARTDDSRAAAEAARRVRPEANAALDWVLAQEPAMALPLARALAVLSEQYSPDVQGPDALARAARDPGLLAAATAVDLRDIGFAVSYSDIDLAAELAVRALERAGDDASVLAARLLAGYTDAYLDRGASALAALAVAEPLARRAGDPWQLAMVHQAQGIALRGLGEGVAAMDAFVAGMRAFAVAGDAMHVNNARYLMASTAAATGYRREEAVVWVEECVAYARATGNRHELAHALLTRVALTQEPAGRLAAAARADLVDAVGMFQAVGDLRCLARCHFRLAAHQPPAQRPPLLEQALEVATRAHDAGHQAAALEGLVAAHWQAGAFRRAATTLGALVGLVGRDAALERCPPDLRRAADRWQAAIAEGLAGSR